METFMMGIIYWENIVEIRKTGYECEAYVESSLLRPNCGRD